MEKYDDDNNDNVKMITISCTSEISADGNIKKQCFSRTFIWF